MNRELSDIKDELIELQRCQQVLGGQRMSAEVDVGLSDPI
jgi:hypothetical protein